MSLLGFMFYVFHFIIEKTNFRALTSLTQDNRVDKHTLIPIIYNYSMCGLVQNLLGTPWLFDSV